MKEYLFKQQKLGSSGTFNDNFLWNDNNIYIMDNHRLAAWCWSKHFNYIDPIYLFHIDRHYDCCQLSINEAMKISDIDLKSSSLNDYRKISFPYDGGDDELPLIRWDNYISAFDHFYNISKAMFLTHQDGGDVFWNDYDEQTSFLLLDNIDYWINKEKNVILNVDLDYFFVDSNNETIISFSDTYLKRLFGKIRILLNKQKVRVLTIALSPDCCGGWKPPMSVLEIIKEVLDIDIVI